MELNQSEGVVAQPTLVNSYFSADETYTFVFQNNEQEEVRTIAANVLQRYPKCMLTRMVNSLVSTRRTADGGYIVKDRNLEMVDYIINFMQRKLFFNFLFITDKKKKYPVDTERDVNVHKTFTRSPGRVVNVVCTFNLCPMSAR